MSKVLHKPTIEYRACLACQYLQKDLIEKKDYFEWHVYCGKDRGNLVTFNNVDCPDWGVKDLL